MNTEDSEETKKKKGLEKISNLKKLIPYLSQYKFLLAMGCLGMLVSIAVSFGLGIAIKHIIDGFPSDTAQAMSFLNNLLLFALVLVVVAGVAGYVASYSLRKLATYVTRDLRTDIFQRILNKHISYIEQQSSGDMQTRIIADTSAVGGFLTNQVPIIISALLSLIVGVVGAIYISFKMTIIVLACLPLIFLPFLVVSKPLRRLGRVVQTALAEVGALAGETFRNIKVVRAYNNEITESSRFGQRAQEAVKFVLQRDRLELGMSTIVESIAYAGFAFLLWSAGKDIFTGAMTLGQLVAFGYFTLFIVQSAGRFLKILTSLNVAVGTANKVLEYLADEPLAWKQSDDKSETRGDLVFENIQFSYPSRPEVEVLKGVNLKFGEGQHIALVGPSGAGKSTIFELLLRFYDVERGKILLGQQDILAVDARSFRSTIAYVPQKESLISGTVRDNICYGLDTASDDAMIEAAKLAHAHDFILDLPEGYDTELGEVGGRLSGGQKQRIALARALIRKPHVLLLDEAKSALDAESETLVTGSIEEWARRNRVAVITIAHRLSTVENADYIYVLDKGVLVGEGTHSDLLSSCQLYKNLSQLNFSEVQQEQNTEVSNDELELA